MTDDRIRELAKPFECYADSQKQTIRGDDIVAFARAVQIELAIEPLHAAAQQNIREMMRKDGYKV